MNIYDFDKTIYDGDSSIDFLLFEIKRNKKVFLTLPKTVIYAFLYKLKIIKKIKFKEQYFSFLKYINKIDEEVDAFWKLNKNKIKDFYKKQHKKTDIIISASPFFLLKPICKELNVNLIATEVDKNTGKFLSENCYGEEKVKRLKKINIFECDEFYSDSLSDTPLKNISKKAFIVNKEKIIPWPLKTKE